MTNNSSFPEWGKYWIVILNVHVEVGGSVKVLILLCTPLLLLSVLGWIIDIPDSICAWLRFVCLGYIPTTQCGKRLDMMRVIWYRDNVATMCTWMG